MEEQRGTVDFGQWTPDDVVAGRGVGQGEVPALAVDGLGARRITVAQELDARGRVQCGCPAGSRALMGLYRMRPFVYCSCTHCNCDADSREDTAWVNVRRNTQGKVEYRKKRALPHEHAYALPCSTSISTTFPVFREREQAPWHA